MHWNRIARGGLWGGSLALLLALAGPAGADDRKATYRVEITNITKGQTFTPLLVATHSRRVTLFTAGGAASRELEILAEDGDTAPLTEALESKGRNVGEVVTIPGLLGPGEVAEVEVRAGRGQSHISVGAMLIPTNDTFMALNGAGLPYFGTRHYEVPAWDAGTEENDQSCRNIPGPRCQGEGFSEDPAEGDEGFVHISNGFHDLGDEDEEGSEVLGPFTYDWRNPVARISVRRVR